MQEARQPVLQRSMTMMRTVGLFGAGFLAAMVVMGERSDRSARQRAEDIQNKDSASCGNVAATPHEIGGRGWWAIIRRTYREIGRDRVMAVSAGVTFYGILALFPALAAFVSLYGLVASPETIMDHLGILAGVLPNEGFEFIRDHISRLSAAASQTLGISLITGVLLSLWSANAGVKAIFDALNVAYGEDEKRGFIPLNIISLVVTLGFIVFAIVASLIVVALPVALDFVYLGGMSEPLLRFGRWPVMLLVLVAGLAVLYRYGPSRESAKWRWISPGALLAAVVWLAASVGLSWYVANFEDYDNTYGAVGAAIALMMWMWVSVIIIMVGAELNAETERQTVVDTTTGEPVPAGLRGADAADRKPWTAISSSPIASPD